MKKDKPEFGNLMELFQLHIEAAVASQVQERIQAIKKEQTQKLFYSLAECEELLGISRRALKARHSRGTLVLCYYNCNTLLMPCKEFDRLVFEIKRAG